VMASPVSLVESEVNRGRRRVWQPPPEHLPHETHQILTNRETSHLRTLLTGMLDDDAAFILD